MNDVTLHPSAIIEDGAVIGKGTKLWHHCHVMKGATIGEECSFGKDCFVADGAVIGNGVRVQNGVSLYKGLRVEDGVFIGPHAVFTNVERPRAFRSGERAETVIGAGATIGASAVIVCGNRIGRYAFVGAGAVVTHDVAAHALVVGNPAKRIGWVSKAGERLPGSGLVRCPVGGESYEVSETSCVQVEPGSPPERVRISEVQAEVAFFRERLQAAFDRTLSRGTFILGEEVLAFEREVAERARVAHAIGVSSGSDALVATLMALGVGAGDEVITTPFSFIASATCIVRVGARPVFVDIDPASFNLDPRKLVAAITPRTKAILPVHLFGRPVDPEVFAIARTHNLPVVEDAAQAAFAETEHGVVGTLGLAGCFSFFPTKNLGGLGDGGIVLTNDEDFARRVRAIRNHGAERRYDHQLLGGNFRLDALQAALLRAKLPELDRLTAARRANAAFYQQELSPITASAELTLPTLEQSVFHHYVVRTPHREELRAYLEQHQVETMVYYPTPIHQTTLFQRLWSDWDQEVPRLPEAETAAREVLAIPVHPYLRERDRRHIIDTFRAFFGSKQYK